MISELSLTLQFIFLSVENLRILLILKDFRVLR